MNASAAAGWGSPFLGDDTGREADIAYRFTVMVDSEAVGEFVSVGGISRTVETEEIQEGGRFIPHVRIKGSKPGHVTFKWGLLDRTYMWDWLDSVQYGKGAEFRRPVTIVQLSRRGAPVRAYQLEQAFPVRVKSADLDGGSSNMAIEEMEIVYDRVTTIVYSDSGAATAVGF